MKKVKVGVMAAMMGMAVVAPAFACDPVKFRSCTCPSGCDQDYCESQGQLHAIIVDQNTGAILRCGYYWTRCLCGGVACAPTESPMTSFIGAITGVSVARAQGAASAPSSNDEISVNNAHGDFSFIKPSAREQESAGVGLQLGMKDGLLTVGGVGEGGPAEKSGLKSGDVVLTVDGKSVRGVKLEQALGSIRGKPGTLVILGIRDAASKSGVRKVPLIRQHLIYRDKTVGGSVLTVRDFEKSEPKEACQKERDGCLFLIEQVGRCYYSCKSAEGR